MPDLSNSPDQSHTGSDQAGDAAAIALIRAKVAAIYSEEPDATTEAREVEVVRSLSKHQTFMHQLTHSGKTLVQIQTDWHNYYLSLPDSEKHVVWQEFYQASQLATPFQKELERRDVLAQTASATQAQPEPESHTTKRHTKRRTPKSLQPVADIKNRILKNVSAETKHRAKSHFKSLGFGLATGAVVLIVFLFGFFNEVVIAPFIQPNRHANATPIIVNTASATVDAAPRVIIPKINLEIPIDYSLTTTAEAAVESGLNNGIIHYPVTATPGQNGNAAFFGHSSNNIFNPGKYKFAFVLLHELVNGDTFYITKDSKVYVYKVFQKTVVEPNDFSVLNSIAGKAATASLITCDPPGTSLRRLVVVGEQISPDPAVNSTPAAPAPVTASTASTGSLPGNGPTLWGRLWQTIF